MIDNIAAKLQISAVDCSWALQLRQKLLNVIIMKEEGVE